MNFKLFEFKMIATQTSSVAMSYNVTNSDLLSKATFGCAHDFVGLRWIISYDETPSGKPFLQVEIQLWKNIIRLRGIKPGLPPTGLEFAVYFHPKTCRARHARLLKGPVLC